MKRTYVEGINGRLIPVKNIVRTSRTGILQCEVSKDTHGYRKGELLVEHRRYIVTKAGFSGCHQLVKPVTSEYIKEDSKC